MLKLMTICACAVVAGSVLSQSVEAIPTPYSDGSIFSETFDGGAFDETGSAFSGAGVGTEVKFALDGVQFTNFAGTDGAYEGTVSVSDNSFFIVETLFSVSNGDISANAMLYRPFSAGYAAEVDILLKGIATGGITDPWDISITDANGTTNAGLSLTREAFHFITMVHLNNLDDEIQLYVDGNLVGTYVDRAPGTDLGVFQIGHVSDSVGFEGAVLTNVSIGVPVPEPASMVLLSLGGLAIIARRR